MYAEAPQPLKSGHTGVVRVIDVLGSPASFES
jgi:hypothetical protein